MANTQALRRRLAFGLAGIGLLSGVAYVLIQFQATLVFAVFLYYASRPIFRKLTTVSLPAQLQTDRIPYRRQLLAVSTIGIFLLPFLFLLIYTLVLVLPELQQLIGSETGSTYISAIQSAQQTAAEGPLTGIQLDVILDSSPEEVIALLNNSAVQSQIERIGSTLISSVGLIASGALHGFILLAGTYYLLTDGPQLVKWFFDTYDNSGIIESYAVAVDAELSSILFGNILNAFLTGIIGILVFTGYNAIAPGVADVPFAPLVGVLTGAGSLIPVVGMKIIYFPVGGLLTVTTLTSGQTEGIAFVLLFLILSFVVVDTIPDFLIRPYVSGNRTHVGLLMFAYILGPIVFGFYGIFLGPILLVLFAQFFRTVGPYVLTGSYSDKQTALSDFD